MTKRKNTKRALLTSVLSLMLCVAMLIGSTFAWFTDTASTNVNKIQSGTLDVDLVNQAGKSIENGTLGWKTADDRKQDDILWEPGCTYELDSFKIVNKGNLALKYKVIISGIIGNAELLDVIDFTVKVGTAEATKLEEWEGILLPAGKTDVAAGEEVGETSLITITGHMREEAGNKYMDKSIEGIAITVHATQYTYENDSNGNDYDREAALIQDGYTGVSSTTQITDQDKVFLTEDIIGGTTLTVRHDMVIDLNGHALQTSNTNQDSFVVEDANVTIKNGTIIGSKKEAEFNSAVFAKGDSTVTLENCDIQMNSNKCSAIVTNGSTSLNTTIIARNCTISAPTVAGKKGYAAYIPAGNVTFENCDMTGHILISGGNVTIDGGTYTATGFNGQSKIWNKPLTIEYLGNSLPGNAYTMGDSILIMDRRSGYKLSGLTIKNVTFNTEIPGAGTAYAIKYVDMAQNGEDRVPYVIENNTFNHKIGDADPVMFIDLQGNDIG